MHGKQVSPVDAYRLCRYEWMHEALSALLDRLPAICHCQQPPAMKPATPELNERDAIYMVVKSERAVALC
jgi:diphosphoinositol-polyphosphate diphosphatase